MKTSRKHSCSGFSLLEVLLAVFILGIGLIMVASVFPVGANWTRQSTDDSVGQTIALNAFSVIQAHYGLNGDHSGQIQTNVITNTLQGLPNFTTVPLGERCYQYGHSTPYPVLNPAVCTFYWTALIKVRSSSLAIPNASKEYDLYICVFRKGDSAQTFYKPPYTVPGGYSEVGAATSFRVRDQTTPNNFTAVQYDWTYEPTLIVGPYAHGTNVVASPPGAACFPPVGYYGIDAVTGTVFRQTVNPATLAALARPGDIPDGENVIVAPAADSTGGSPLVYVYQTSISF